MFMYVEGFMQKHIHEFLLAYVAVFKLLLQPLISFFLRFDYLFFGYNGIL